MTPAFSSTDVSKCPYPFGLCGSSMSPAQQVLFPIQVMFAVVPYLQLRPDPHYPLLIWCEVL